jgi:hypothetical protein
LKGECSCVSITLDLWTPKAKDGYLAVTFHWISNDWRLLHVTADIAQMPYSHSAENIALHLKVGHFRIHNNNNKLYYLTNLCLELESFA